MSLAPGVRLGPYEVRSLIGMGGMGEVYKARDTRLDRTVAIKVLSAHVALDPDLRQRFGREARAISALNHPHICSLYDIGQQDDIDFLVMEYLEGQTLAKRLEKGALALDQALQYAIQIADALDKAHRKGIVHRDLKPGNVMLTKSGVKLLDFGLAKLQPSAAVAGMSIAATMTNPITAQGTILGTLQYMAPEQVEGKEADARTDIFAFGAVLHEMLTGKKAFEGKSQASLIGAIMHADPPPISTVRPLMPAGLNRIVKKSLAKDPEVRWQSAHDLCEELVWIAGDMTNAVHMVTSLRSRWRGRVAWLGLAAAMVAVTILGLIAFRRVAPELPLTRLDVLTPPTSDPVSFSISPDGRQLVFVAMTDSGPKLWLRPLDQAIAQPLARTEGAIYPFWAPDSRALGFFADGKLKRIDLSGGSPHVLADAPYGRGGAWNGDGVIVFARSTTGPLLRIPASGGPIVPVTQLEQTHHASHRWPQFLPDGQGLLFLATNGPEAPGMYLGSLHGGVPKRVLVTDNAAVYAPPGYLLVSDAGGLLARHFELSRAEVADSVSVAQPVGRDTGVFRGAFAVSATGVLAYRATAAGRRQLVWVDRNGTRTGIVGEPDDNALLNPALAPDGERVALQRTIQGNQDIWVLNSSGPATRITFDPAADGFPIWSPDGHRLVFRSNRRNSFELYETLASGGGTAQRLLESAQNKAPLHWSADGRFLLYRVLDQKTGSDLWVLPLDGDRKPFAIVQTPFEETNGELAPDGRWVAYDSNETGRFEVYVQSFPASGGKWQISTAGGIAPRWRHDGRELFYVAPDGALMAVPVRPSTDGQILDRGTPVRLFRVPIAYGGSIPGGNVRHQFAVAPDGQHFLINVTTDEAIAPPITIVQNWTTGLKKK